MQCPGREEVVVVQGDRHGSVREFGVRELVDLFEILVPVREVTVAAVGQDVETKMKRG